MEGLFSEERGYDSENAEKYQSPLSPSPAFAIDNKAADHWSMETISNLTESRTRRRYGFSTYPRPGPKNGVNMNIVDGTARFTGLNVSLIVPPAIANDGAKQKPARNRKTQTPAKV